MPATPVGSEGWISLRLIFIDKGPTEPGVKWQYPLPATGARYHEDSACDPQTTLQRQRNSFKALAYPRQNPPEQGMLRKQNRFMCRKQRLKRHIVLFPETKGLSLLLPAVDNSTIASIFSTAVDSNPPYSTHLGSSGSTHPALLFTFHADRLCEGAFHLCFFQVRSGT